MSDNPQDGWKEEALRLRQNRVNDSAAVAAFVDLFERNLLDGGNVPLVCLALHHVAMRFHTHGGKQTLKKMQRAKLEQLPEAIYPKDRILKC